jgi:hypothetical protein
LQFDRCGFTIWSNVKVRRQRAIVLDKKRYFRSMVALGASASGAGLADDLATSRQ